MAACRGCDQMQKSSRSHCVISTEKPVAADTIVLSTQHDPEIEHKDIEEAAIEMLIKPVVPAAWLKNTRYLINPTGRFCHWRSARRLRSHRPQDHRRYLRRRCAAWRWRFLRAKIRPRSIVLQPMPDVILQKISWLPVLRRAARFKYRMPLESPSRHRSW